MSSWGNVFLKGLPGAVGSVVDYITASRDAKSQRKWQAYNNALVRLQNAQNQNALTTNEGMAVERSAEMEYAIRKSEYMTKASTEVAAAATGTTGRSVDLIMFDVGKNAAEASYKRQQDLEYQLLGIQQQRESSNLQTEMQIDHSTIPGPNAADMVLGLTTNFAKVWNSEGRPSFSSFSSQRLPSRGPVLPDRPIGDVKDKL